MFNVKDIEILSKHIEIVHHVKGRVRLKIDTKIANSGISLGLEDFENLSKNLKGIKSSRLNKIAKSLTIEYDYELIPSSLFDDLNSGNNLEIVVAKLNSLKEIL
jgi:hypothetical protein